MFIFTTKYNQFVILIESGSMACSMTRLAPEKPTDRATNPCGHQEYLHSYLPTPTPKYLDLGEGHDYTLQELVSARRWVTGFNTLISVLIKASKSVDLVIPIVRQRGIDQACRHVPLRLLDARTIVRAAPAT